LKKEKSRLYESPNDSERENETELMTVDDIGGEEEACSNYRKPHDNHRKNRVQCVMYYGWVPEESVSPSCSKAYKTEGYSAEKADL
jgi:hypothetical protein